jgi:putative SOS response-associated peptidase YedK
MCGKFTQMSSWQEVHAFSQPLEGFAGKDDVNPARPKHIHVRSETIDQRRTFGRAFAHAPGILMLHTFNEGEELPNGKTKQWVITPNDGQPLPSP